MRRLINVPLAIAAATGLVLLMNSNGSAQKLPKPIYIQAQAMGESTQ